MALIPMFWGISQKSVGGEREGGKELQPKRRMGEIRRVVQARRQWLVATAGGFQLILAIY